MTANENTIGQLLMDEFNNGRTTGTFTVTPAEPQPVTSDPDPDPPVALNIELVWDEG